MARMCSLTASKEKSWEHLDPKLVVKSYSLGLELVIIFGILCAVHRFSKQPYISVPSDLDINDSDMMVLKTMKVHQ